LEIRKDLVSNCLTGIQKDSLVLIKGSKLRIKLKKNIRTIKYFSMFSGIGGFEYGIRRAFERVSDVGTFDSLKELSDNQSTNQSGRYTASCVGYSEIDKYATKIYKGKFKEGEGYGDCSKIRWENVPDFDLFVGGFPCQAFSIAGKRKGFEDTRGTLFFEILRALRAKKPKHILLENVKGLLSHERGRTYGIIKDSLEELGYFVERQTLNSANFGVPQSRERVFLVGHLREKCRQQIFPLRKAYGEVKKIQLKLKQIGEVGGPNEAGRVYDTVGISRTIKNGGGMGAKTGLYKIGDWKIRRLTPRECERLQGFPDDWTLGLSDGQRYKCLGNAVTTTVVQKVIETMIIKGCL